LKIQCCHLIRFDASAANSHAAMKPVFQYAASGAGSIQLSHFR
jgi:hypothetical protein